MSSALPIPSTATRGPGICSAVPRARRRWGVSGLPSPRLSVRLSLLLPSVSPVGRDKVKEGVQRWSSGRGSVQRCCDLGAARAPGARLPHPLPAHALGKGPRGGRRPRDGEGCRSRAGKGGAPRLAPHLKELQAPAPVEAQNPRPG